jgi:starch synthase
MMISAECAPAVKVGGLGDFIAGLARELAALGHQTEVVLPKYDCLRLERIWDLRKVFDVWVPLYEDWVHCDVEQGQADGLTCYFIDPHCPQAFFQRGRVYGEEDDAERFAFFCRATLEFLLKSGHQPDILHCHEWQAGLIPVLLYETYENLGIRTTRVCYTLHNAAHQGRCAAHVLRQVGLDPARLMTADRLQDTDDPSLVNLMQGGIVYANYVTTVSPRYAWEIQHLDDLGGGLGPLLQRHREKFGGILNGIDYEVWNPETDPNITQTYCAETLQRKARNKAALRIRLGLEDAFRPIVAMVGRLDPQKGLELIRHGVAFALQNEAQVAMLGMAQDPSVDAGFRDLKQQLIDDPHCHLELAYDEELAHQVYAGADIVLIPSRYEPCGLTQMIAMRYGAVPVVRGVGGLADTVFDANYSDRAFEERNGYVFQDYTTTDLEAAASRAIGLWFHHPAYFRQLRINGMRQDHSWAEPARRYLDIFLHITH